MTLNDVSKLQVGDNIRCVETDGSTVAGVVTDKGYSAVKVLWSDGKSSSLYFDGTGTIHQRCKKVE